MPVDTDTGTRDLGLFSLDVLALSYFLIFVCAYNSSYCRVQLYCIESDIVTDVKVSDRDGLNTDTV